MTSIPVNGVILGHVGDSGDVVSRCSCPGAVQSACHDALKVALFCTAFRALSVGRPLWREGKDGGGKESEIRKEKGEFGEEQEGGSMVEITGKSVRVVSERNSREQWNREGRRGGGRDC